MKLFQVNFFSKIISIFFIVLIFISIFFLLFLSYKPIKIQDYSFINKYLINFDDLKIKNTGDIFLSFNKSSKNFELIVEDFETEDIFIPDLLLATDIRTILTGNLRPNILKIFDAKINLNTDLVKLKNKIELNPLDIFTQLNKKDFKRNELNNFFSLFKIIEINNTKLKLFQKDKDIYLDLEPIDLRFESEKNRQFVSLSLNPKKDENSNFQIELEKKDQIISTKASIFKFDLANIFNFIYKKDVFKKLSSSGKMITSFDNSLEISNLDLAILSDVIINPNFSNDNREIKLSNLKLEGNLNKLSDLEVKSIFNYNEAILSVDYLNNKNNSKVLIGCEEIFFDELITLWPNQFKQSARNWVENNVKGKINDLEINLAYDNNLKQEKFSGGMRFKDVMLNYVDGMPRVVELSGDVTLSDEEVLINFDSGFSKNLILKQGSIKLYDLKKPIENAIVKLKIDSKTDYVREYLNFSPIEEKNYEKLKKINGPILIDLTLNFPLLLDLDAEEIIFDSKIQILDGELNNIVEWNDLKKFELLANIDNDKVVFDGKGVFNNIEIKFSGSELYDNLYEEVFIESKFNSENTLILLNNNLDNLSGIFTLKANYNLNKIENSSKINGTIELENFSFQDKFLGDNLKKSENGLINFDLNLLDGQLSFFKIDVLSDSLDIDLQIENQLSEFDAEIKTFISPYQNFKGNIIKKENIVKIDLKGEKLNINKFLKSENKIYDTDFSLMIDKLILDEKEIENPILTGKIRKQMYESLNFEQNYFDKDGTQVSHSIKIFDELNIKKLSIFSNNFAEMFSYLRKNESFKSGVLSVKAQMKNNRYNGNIIIEDFVSYDIPFFAQLFSFFSLKGLEQKIKDGGIYFDKLSTKFVFDENKVYFKNAFAKGSDLGLSFSGMVNIITDSYDIDGLYVPAYTLNTLLTELPIVGNIITAGSPEEGLIAAKFSIKNDSLNETIFEFNPISVIVPNIIKNILDSNKDELPIQAE